MLFLADENLPGPVVVALRERGHDVFWIKESMPGADDPVILDFAQRERRVVVTADTDFGELAFRFGLPAQCGVVWINPDDDNGIIVAALLSRDDWSGVFAVVESDRVRIRRLPSSAANEDA